MKIEINLPEFKGFAYIGEYRKPLRHDCFLDHDHTMIVTDDDGHYTDDYVFIYIREPKPEPTLLERIEAAYPDRKIYRLYWVDDYLYLNRNHQEFGHLHAQSMKGFYKYVYLTDEDVLACNSTPISEYAEWETVAVLFNK